MNLNVFGNLFSGVSAEGGPQRITPQKAKEMMDKGGVTVVDVRQPEEYAAGHIPGAVLVPNESIGSRQPKALPDLDAVLLVHCHSGNRAGGLLALMAARDEGLPAEQALALGRDAGMTSTEARVRAQLQVPVCTSGSAASGVPEGCP